jgi:hypothetical protein
MDSEGPRADRHGSIVTDCLRTQVESSTFNRIGCDEFNKKITVPRSRLCRCKYGYQTIEKAQEAF